MPVVAWFRPSMAGASLLSFLRASIDWSDCLPG